ncbi:MAG: tRNA (cytidine(34)-2'-O)-methyltransferase [Proteobacteria bacterium]|nr:tRNA (cytidine(34)-2'-O)-methyltransferase [Pseudomonadota bacterium]
MPRVVLLNPEIPPNTGNIARLCVATDCELHLIKPLGFSLSDKYLKRAGLDYWDHLKLFVHSSFKDFLSVKDGELYFFSSKGIKIYTEIEYNEKDYLIFGAETAGFPPFVFKDFSDRIYTIPMFGKVRCLNLSNSVSIVLYEALRRLRGF